MGKIRHVNFHPDEWLVGASVLKADERGCYITVCALIYSNGGPIRDDARDLAKLCNITQERWARIRGILLAKGKLRLVDGLLTNGRCEIELEKALNRTTTARKTGTTGGQNSAISRQKRGRVSNDNSNLIEADASGDRKLTTNHKPQTKSLPQSPDGGSNVEAEFDRWYRAYPKRVAKGQAEKAYRTARKAVDADTLLRAAEAYARAVAGKDAKYTPNPATWLNGQRWLDDGLLQGSQRTGNRQASTLNEIPLFFDTPTEVQGSNQADPKTNPAWRNF
ncbi:uncharacterized protein DUF1376 [Azospirillum brasilense]|nr:uncharacterized protein DUF1376 [Azospirillum brasilense]